MGKFKKKNNNPTFAKPKTRKEIRKEKRLSKKKRTRNERCQSESTKVVPVKALASKNKSLKEGSESTHDKQLKQRQKDQKAFKELEEQMRKQRKRQLREANEEEDRVIKDLEKKLKLNRRKSKSLPKSFVSEGLDYLLEVCHYDKFKDAVSLEKELHEAGDEFEDDLALITGSVRRKTESRASDAQISDNDDILDEEEDEDGDENDDFSVGDDEEDLSVGDDEEDSVERDSEVESEDEDDTPLEKRKKLDEDIYGRVRDQKGNVVKTPAGRYVPPHLRTQQTDETNENLLRLTKQMKGCLNRLTEKNMHSVAAEMEDLYAKHSRHDVNSTLLKLLLDSLVSAVLSPERIVIDHAMLISILHANIGSEIGAEILQRLVDEFAKLFQTNPPVEDKHIDNVVLFLCHLYNFKIFHACLVYDVLNRFVDKFEEKDIELILIVLKNVGFNLRKDDSIALKELILKVQRRANDSSSLRENARVRFMLDTLTAVKNNNMLKVQNYDPAYADHLKKIQKSLLRSGKYVTELKISLEDLLNVDTRGRWWVVGSAWSGGAGTKDDDKTNAFAGQTLSFDQKVLALAKKQRMNTESRINIFCTLMTAETYMDACEKLLKLGLKGRQYQEILHVLLHCLLQEKQYNPYYAFIAEHLCDVDRKYQLAVQFSVWDRLKEIDSLKTKQITSLAKFLSYLFLEQKLPLSVLKTLQFTEMKKGMVRLVRQILLAILLSDDESIIATMFSKISKSEKLLALREGLQLFLRHFVLKNVEETTTTHEDESANRRISLLRKRVELAENAMQNPVLAN